MLSLDEIGIDSFIASCVFYSMKIQIDECCLTFVISCSPIVLVDISIGLQILKVRVIKYNMPFFGCTMFNSVIYPECFGLYKYPSA